MGEIVAYYAADIKSMDEEYLQDAACLALNMLPFRYINIKHDVAFFLTSSERKKITTMVFEVVEKAIAQAEKYKEDRPETIEGN